MSRPAVNRAGSRSRSNADLQLFGFQPAPQAEALGEGVGAEGPDSTRSATAPSLCAASPAASMKRRRSRSERWLAKSRARQGWSDSRRDDRLTAVRRAPAQRADRRSLTSEGPTPRTNPRPRSRSLPKRGPSLDVCSSPNFHKTDEWSTLWTFGVRTGGGI